MTKIKDKERILKASREKQLDAYKRAPISLSHDFSTEAFQVRRDSHEMFKVIKSKDLHARLLCPGKLSSKIEGKLGASQTIKT